MKLFVAAATLVVLGLVALWFLRRPSKSDQPVASFKSGDVVVLNAIGVGTIVGESEQPAQDGTLTRGYLVSVREGTQQAFVPGYRVAAILHPISDRGTAERMLETVLNPAVSASQDAGERRKRAAELWEHGSHLEQAEYLGQLLALNPQRDEDTAGVVALITGNHHLLREISHVLAISENNLRDRTEARYPWLQGKWMF
jgi:RNA polymerase-interacting CarD/CdnL/TRCF family regulator